MPDGDGCEFVRRIRALPPDLGGLTPAIVLSGKTDIESSLRAGFHVHLVKPANARTLVELVRSFLLDGTETGSTWTVSTPRPDIALVALSGNPTKRDVRAVAVSVVELLEANPRQLIIDLRRVDRFEVSAGSVGEQALWGARRRIVGVTVLGGPYMARLAARTLCVTLGVACSFLSSAALEAFAAAG